MAAIQKNGDVIIKPLAGTEPITDESLDEFERRYSITLPQSYRNFLIANNGGFPSKDCIEFNEAKRRTATDVFYFFALVDSRDSISAQWYFSTFRGRIPKATLPIARDSHGNLWLLSLAGGSMGAVHFWDHGTFDTFDETELTQWPVAANSFDEFLRSLSDYDSGIEDGVVLSRYAITKQAISGMQQAEPDFSVQENLEYVWHCDCDNDGNVRMQFVVYAVHAAFTHTDGYSRVSAMQGLIKDGPTRLPN